MNGENTAPTIGEYYESYQVEKLCHSCERRDTYSSPEGQLLFCRVEGYESLFSDMLFEADSSTGKFIKVQEKVSAEWHDIDISRPDHLKGFTYRWFVFDVEDLDNGFLGKYSPLEYKLTVAPKCVDQDDVILHEMIHLHEAVLDGLSTYYRDIVLYCLCESRVEKGRETAQKSRKKKYVGNKLDTALLCCL